MRQSDSSIAAAGVFQKFRTCCENAQETFHESFQKTCN